MCLSSIHFFSLSLSLVFIALPNLKSIGINLFFDPRRCIHAEVHLYNMKD